MQKNKLTVIIDGNWLFMTRIFTCSRELRADLPIGYTHLASGFVASIQAMRNRLPQVDNWMVVTDGGSWRKKLEIPQNAAKYKGNRESDPNYNWEKIWKTFGDLQKSLRSQGVMCVNAEGIEGDDWCAYWSGKLRQEGICNIIWTKDHDLMQLVKESKGVWTGWYNEKDGLYLNKTQDPANMFMTPFSYSSELLFSLMLSVPKVSYINPVSEIIVEKIFLGDSSDNIKPIIWTNKTSKGISSKVFKLPKKDLQYDIDIWDDDAVNSFISNTLMRDKYSHLTFEEVRKHFEYNRTLVVLSSRVYPDSVKQIILENAGEYQIAPNNISIDINPESESINDIIDLI